MDRIEVFSHVYYVTINGESDKNDFADECDKRMLLELLKEIRKKMRIEVYAYCITDNQFHVVLNTIKYRLSEVMEPLLESYSQYFLNRKKPVSGILRKEYQKEQLRNLDAILRCTCGLHRLPVDEGFVKRVEDYWWSSYTSYRKESLNVLIERDFLLLTFDEDRKKAVRQFLKYQATFV